VIHEEALQISRAANLPLMRLRSPSSAALKRASSPADASAQIKASVQGEGVSSSPTERGNATGGDRTERKGRGSGRTVAAHAEVPVDERRRHGSP
jgi:hypothetical protein